MSKRAEQLQRDYLAKLEQEKSKQPVKPEIKSSKDKTAGKNKEDGNGKRILVKRNIKEFIPFVSRGTLKEFQRRWQWPPYSYNVDLRFLK